MTEQTDTILSPTTVKFASDNDQDSLPMMTKSIDRYSRLMMNPSMPSKNKTTSAKSLLARSPPNSLNRLMANRGSLKAVHASFVRNMESSLRLSQRKAVSFEAFEEIDYGYGDAAPCITTTSNTTTSNTSTTSTGNKEEDPTDYGYGDASPDESQQHQSMNNTEEEPAMKRRRYQRRNSKTPAMLMAMNAPLLLHLEFLEDHKEHLNSSCPSLSSPFSTGSGVSLPKDSWDGGLEIAEELVKHLQKRRQSQT